MYAPNHNIAIYIFEPVTAHEAPLRPYMGVNAKSSEIFKMKLLAVNKIMTLYVEYL